MNDNHLKVWSKGLFEMANRPSHRSALLTMFPPAQPGQTAPPTARDLMIPPELAHEMDLIDAYAANAEEYGYQSAPTLESLRELVAHLSQLKKGGAA